MNDNELDAVLFRFWIRMAGTKPSAVMGALMHCLTPDDYRRALLELAELERINLPLQNERGERAP